MTIRPDRIASAVLVLIAAAVLPQAAKAQALPAASLIAEFKSMCIAGNADRKFALAEADKGRWGPFDASHFASGGETYNEARLGDDGRNKQLLLLQEKIRPLAGLSVRLRSCAVMATVDDPRAVIVYAERLAGPVRPFYSDPQGREWIFAQTPDGPAAVRSAADEAQVIRSGRFRHLMVSEQQTGNPGGNTALVYMVGLEP